MALELPPGTIFKPFGDTIYARMYTQPETIGKTGLYRPDQSREEVFFARVLVVGPGVQIDVSREGKTITLPMDVKPNMDVVFKRYHGEKIEIEGALYVLLKRADVLCIVKIPEDLKGKFVTPAGTSDTVNDLLEENRAEIG